MPSYIRTLEEVFGKGNVYLVTLSSDYDHIGISTHVVVASPQPLEIDDFTKFIHSVTISLCYNKYNNDKVLEQGYEYE